MSNLFWHCIFIGAGAKQLISRQIAIKDKIRVCGWDSEPPEAKAIFSGDYKNSSARVKHVHISGNTTNPIGIVRK